MSPPEPPTAAAALPSVDLRLLSSTDIRSLAADLRHRCGDAADHDLVVPQIDRSVFNESPASRKQTYSRFRLRRPSSGDPNRRRKQEKSLLSAAVLPGGNNHEFGEDEKTIMADRLIRLFAPQAIGQCVNTSCDDEPMKFETLDQSENLNRDNLDNVVDSTMFDSESLAVSENHDATVQDAETLAESENPSRADGDVLLRPEEQLEPLVVEESQDGDQDQGLLNGNGEEVNLVELGEKGDCFDEELRRRTAGFLSEEQLVNFMSGFEGQWGSHRKKTRIVDAAEFGDYLPKGWKLLLSIRRKNNDMWVFCKKYISPSQKKFASCKEVSVYLLSLNGQLNISQSTFVNNDGSISEQANIVPNDLAGSLNISEKQSCTLGEPRSPSSDNHHEQVQNVENMSAEKATDIPRCLNCNLNFSDKDAYQQHRCSYHQSTKRHKRGGQYVDGVIVKDGKFECQFCHKSFTERHRYVGHVGSHVRYKVQTGEAVSDKKSSRKKSKPSLPSPVPYIVSSISDQADDLGNLAVKSADKPHITSPTSMIDTQLLAVSFCSQYREPDPTDFIFSSKIEDDSGNFGFTISRSRDFVESSNCRSEEFVAPLDASGTTNFNIVTQEDFTNRTADAQQSQSCVNKFIVKDVSNSTSVQCIKPDVCKDRFLHLNVAKQESVLEDSKATDNSYFNMTSIPNMDLAKINNDTANEMCQASSMSISFGENNVNADDFVSELETDVTDAFGMETSSCFDSISMPLYNSNGCANHLEKNATSFTSVSNIKGYTAEHDSEDGKVYVPTGSSSETNFLSSGSFLGRGAVTSSTVFDKPNANSANTSFINGNTCGIWMNTESMLDFVSEESILEATDNCKGLDNFLNMNGVGYGKLDASDNAQHNNGRKTFQNVENFSTASQKQDKILGFQHAQTDASESPGYASLNAQGTIPVPKPPAESCFMPGFENVDHVTHQLNWGQSLPNNSHQLSLVVCIWCDGQFSHENSGGTDNTDSLGFLCPACKTKISGYINDIGDG